MKVHTTREMKEREARAAEQGISYLQLMENAGVGVAQDLIQRYSELDSVLILCGKGNNAGDGLVVARTISHFYPRVDVLFLLGTNLSELTKMNYQRLPKNINLLDRFDSSLVNEKSLVIDAVFGTGFNGDLLPFIQDIFCIINQTLNSNRVALDVPSGVCADDGTYSSNSFRAQLSYVFDSYKPLHEMPQLQTYFGELILIDIGIPPG